MDWRRTRGASGNGPRIAWLPMTINSVSPVMPLDARRMCSRSERFIATQDAHPLLLRHNDCKWAAVPHAKGVLAAVGQLIQDASQAARANQVQPFLQAVLG